MNKLYSVHDHWTDINKKNDVDIESIDGVITGIKVNGEDYGGGGGSSDFSTATVTFENVDSTTRPYRAVVTSVESDSIKSVDGEVLSPFTVTVPLYKGMNILPASCIHFNDESYMPTTVGSVEFSIDSMGFVVTGNGTIKAKGTVKAK